MQSAATPPRTMTSVFPLKYVLLAFASYFVAMDAIFAAVWFAVAVLIFWRRSDDRMGLFASLALLTFGTATYIGRSPAFGRDRRPAAWTS